MSLNKVLLIRSTNDSIVIPSFSEHFEFFEQGTTKVITSPLNATDTYKYDWIGLKTLDQQGKLALEHVPCEHQYMASNSCRPYVWNFTKSYVGTILEP